VIRISVAPVKSLGLTHPQSVEIRRFRAVGDRRFWLVDADGRLVNGKVCPALMRVRPEWDDAGSQHAGGCLPAIGAAR